MKKTWILPPKGCSEKNRRGVCNIKLIQSKLHPTQGLFDAIPKLAMRPSDCRALTVSVGHSVTVHGRFVAGQCLLPLTLFMIAPARPLALIGGIKWRRKTKGKKWQEKVNCYWQIPTHFLGDSRWNHGTVNTCCPKSALLESNPNCHPQDTGSGPLIYSLRCSPTEMV